MTATMTLTEFLCLDAAQLGALREPVQIVPDHHVYIMEAAKAGNAKP